MSELDLRSFLKESSLANLDWLDVDEEEYRKNETLPKQNLDIQPDLEALWNRNDESPTAYLIPNVVTVPTDGIVDPKTMGDMSQVHGKLRNQAEEIRKVARLAIMQSDRAESIQDKLIKRFGKELLREHRSIIADVLKERGLLGRLYISASDFPSCSKTATIFVQKFAKKARYVLAKKECSDCIHANKTTTGACHCGVFHKEVKVDVPFTEALAEDVENAQRACGCSVEASSKEPKERIRKAFLAPKIPKSHPYEGTGQKQIAGQLNRLSSEELKAKSVVQFLYKEMAKGLSREAVEKALRLAFDANTLIRTYPKWQRIFKEAGLYGILYIKQAGFDDCHAGAYFLSKHNSKVRAIVAGDKCDSCAHNKGRCELYGKPLYKNASEIVSKILGDSDVK